MTKLFLLAFLMFSGASKVYSQNPLTDSLIAWYPFDGNSDDASGNGNNGTVYSATLTDDRFGNPNSAYYFNGFTDYIEYFAGTKFKPSDFPMSITCWIKSNDNAPIGPFFKNDAEADHYTGISFQIQVDLGGVLELHYGDGGTTSSGDRRSKFGTLPVNDNQWHFVAGVVRGATDMDLYIDCYYDPGYYDGAGGNLSYSTASGSSGVYDVVAGTFYYKGILDDVRFYHRELTLTDLQTIYSYPNPYGNLSVSLGADTLLCSGSQLTLSPASTGSIVSYIWSDGSSSSSITINEPGTYWVTVFDGCSISSDTINVGFGKPVAVYLPSDTTLCLGETLVLDAGNFYDSYLWSTGETTSSISVTDSGLYAVTVGLNGCTTMDSINVSFILCNDINPVNNEPGFCIAYAMETHTLQITNPKMKHTGRITLQLLNSIGQKLWQMSSVPVYNKTLSIQLPDNLADGIFVVYAEIENETVARQVINYIRY